MSDGGLNEYDNEEFRYIQQIVRNREDEGKLSVFPVYAQEKPKYDKIAEKWKPISKKTYEKRERLMSKFSNIKQRLIYINFSDADEFTRLFQFLHKKC